MTARRDRRVGRAGAAFGGGSSTVFVTSIAPDIGFRLLTGSTAPYLRTIKGGGFSPASTVTIGGVAATNVTYVDPNTLTCNVGTLGSAGAKDVTVTTGPLSDTRVGLYTVELAELWFRGDVGNGASWTDLGDNGQHAVQATGANQPAVTASAINGLPGLTGDAVNDSMLAPCVMNTAQHVTYVAMKANANTVGNEGIRCFLGVGATGDNNSANSCALYRSGTSITEFSTPNVLCSTAGAINGVAMMVEDLFDGTNNTIRVNATTGTPVGQTATMNIDRMNLFSRFLGGAPSIFGPYTICEVLVFDHVPAAGVRTKIRTYIANRYNQANFI